MEHLPTAGQPAIRLGVRAGVLTPTRFVIFTTGRAGSVLLVSLLSSTPGIECRREILGRRPIAARPWGRLHAHAARAALRGATAWGSSVHPEELSGARVGDRKQWLGRLHDSGFRVITLIRRNPVSAALSAALADARHTWHHKADVVPPPERLDPLTVLRLALFQEQKLMEVEAFVGERSHLALTYEDDLRDPHDQQVSVGRIRDFLQLPPASATTPLVRLSTPVYEQVENFDEIAELLATSPRFRVHLDEILESA